MSTEYYNSQWQMPNEANKGKQANHSLNFDGSQQINVSDLSSIPTGASPRTVSAWFNSSYSGTGEPVIISYGASANAQMFNIMLKGGSGADAGRLRFVGYNRDHTFTTADLRDSQWHHVAITYNGTIVEAFLDGSSVGNFTPSSALNTGTSFFRIGVEWTYWKGQISQLCIFDYVLSPSQVTTLWGGGTSVSNPMDLSPAPKVYYKLFDSMWNGSNYITPNSAVKDYVFNFYSPNVINTGNFLTIIKDLTLSGWVNFTATNTSSSTIISKHIISSSSPYFTYQLYIENNGAKFRIGTTTHIIITGNKTNLNDGKWHHILGTYDGSNINLYVDGVSDATAVSASGDLNTAVKDTTVGAVIDGGTGSIATGTVFLGNLSNIKIFNKALSAPEVETLYNYGSPIRTLANIPQNSNLKAWYKLDASEFYDQSNTQWQIANNVLSDKAYSFNGTNNIEITQNSSIQTSSFSIGAWIKGYPQDNKIIIENGGINGFYLYTQTNGRVYCKVGGGVAAVTQAGALNGEWNFVWFTFSGLPRAGLNGSYNSGGGGSGNTPNYDSSKGLFIGSKSDSTTGFVGEIAQVVYYNGRGSNSASGTYGTVPTNPPASSSDSASLVSWWKLDATNITDSNGSNNGTNNGATLIDTNVGRPAGIGGLSTGMSRFNLVQSDLSRVFNDNALSLWGGTSRYNLGAMYYTFKPSGSNFTFSVWLRNTSTARGGIFSKGSTNFNASDFGVIIEGDPGGSAVTGDPANDGKIVFIIGGNTASTRLVTNTVLTSGQWYNFVATYTSGDLKLYLNGSFDNSTTSITKSSFNASQGAINGCLSNGWNFSGQTSNFAFFDTVLSATEVREIWNNGLPGDLKSHSKVSNLTNWLKGAKGTDRAHTMDYVSPYSTQDSYSLGLAGIGFTDFQGTSSGFTAPSTTVTNIVNDAPYSNKNAVSYNMASMDNEPQPYSSVVSGRSTDTPQAT